MKTIQIEIPEGYEAKWVDGVLTLVDEQPQVAFKFNVGDRVVNINDPKIVYTIKDRLCPFDEPCYELYDGWGITVISEKRLELYTPKDITERIKTFEDACAWCLDNKYSHLVRVWEDFNDREEGVGDIEAYLKLRIITCALNEGWEPMFEKDEERYSPYIQIEDTDDEDASHAIRVQGIYGDSAKALDFKSRELAIYAAKQFKDIYMDFCYKGKE